MENAQIKTQYTCSSNLFYYTLRLPKTIQSSICMGAVLDVPLLGRMRLLRRLGELRRRLSARRRDELRKERSRSLQLQRGVVELDHAPRIHDGNRIRL